MTNTAENNLNLAHAVEAKPGTAEHEELQRWARAAFDPETLQRAEAELDPETRQRAVMAWHRVVEAERNRLLDALGPLIKRACMKYRPWFLDREDGEQEMKFFVLEGLVAWMHEWLETANESRSVEKHVWTKIDNHFKEYGRKQKRHRELEVSAGHASTRRNGLAVGAAGAGDERAKAGVVEAALHAEGYADPETWAAARRVFGELGPRERAITLLLAGGMTLREIAQVVVAPNRDPEAPQSMQPWQRENQAEPPSTTQQISRTRLRIRALLAGALLLVVAIIGARYLEGPSSRDVVSSAPRHSPASGEVARLRQELEGLRTEQAAMSDRLSTERAQRVDVDARTVGLEEARAEADARALRLETRNRELQRLVARLSREERGRPGATYSTSRSRESLWGDGTPAAHPYEGEIRGEGVPASEHDEEEVWGDGMPAVDHHGHEEDVMCGREGLRACEPEDREEAEE